MTPTLVQLAQALDEASANVATMQAKVDALRADLYNAEADLRTALDSEAQADSALRAKLGMPARPVEKPPRAERRTKEEQAEDVEFARLNPGWTTAQIAAARGISEAQAKMARRAVG